VLRLTVVNVCLLSGTEPPSGQIPAVVELSFFRDESPPAVNQGEMPGAKAQSILE
jgi:hypothetical protein